MVRRQPEPRKHFSSGRRRWRQAQTTKGHQMRTWIVTESVLKAPADSPIGQAIRAAISSAQLEELDAARRGVPPRGSTRVAWIESGQVRFNPLVPVDEDVAAELGQWLDEHPGTLCCVVRDFDDPGQIGPWAAVVYYIRLERVLLQVIEPDRAPAAKIPVTHIVIRATRESALHWR